MAEIKVIVDDEGHDVDAVFDEQIEIGEGGGVSETRVRQIVQETAVTQESDPTVPDWAKQEEKPEYTYEEIKEKPTLVEGVSAEIKDEENEEEQTQVLTLKLEDKDGNEIASTQVTLPKAELPDLTDYVKNTDYATAENVGVIKTKATKGFTVNNNGELAIYQASEYDLKQKKNLYNPITPFMLDKAVKVGITTNTETWTDDEMQSARNLIGAVGEEDYASTSKAGVVKVNAKSHGMQINSASGEIYPLPANKTQIDNRENYRWLTPAFLDYATMSALADCKDATLWTDDTTVDGQVVKGTKTKALELLGAIKKVEYNSTDGALQGRVYIVDRNNAQTSRELRITAKADSIPIRNANGNFYVGAPKNQYEVTPKSYVDNLPDNLTLTDDEKAKWRGMMGATKLYLHEVTTPSGKIAIVNKYSGQYATVNDLFNNVWGQSTDLSTHFPVSSKLLNFSPDEPVLPLFHVYDHGTSISVFSIDSQSADSGVYNGFVSYTIEKTAEITDTVTEL